MQPPALSEAAQTAGPGRSSALQARGSRRGTAGALVLSRDLESGAATESASEDQMAPRATGYHSLHSLLLFILPSPSTVLTAPPSQHTRRNGAEDVVSLVLALADHPVTLEQSVT